MADDWDSWYGGGWDQDWSDYFNPQPTANVNEVLFGDAQHVDQHAQDLFRDAFFHNDSDAYTELQYYLWQQYDIDFEDAFTWEDFRDWYKANH